MLNLRKLEKAFLMLKTTVSVLLFILFLQSCKQTPPVKTTPSTAPKEISYVRKPVSGKPLQEFRGVWVASIANIDWPSRRGLSTENQKKEFEELAKSAKETGLNALLVQVRAATDAFYEKSFEPWSEWLMGEQGKAPEPLYDPMDHMIKVSHRQGLEFHAWLNLNRGMHKKATSITPDHITKTKPDWFLSYDGYQLFNFGIPEVRDYITAVVSNIVRNYDVDGIHFDDYFYPYKVTGQNLDDEATFKKYPAGFKSIDDWRRNNIDLLITQIAGEIKKEKPWVVFGISPFGVWRNKSDDPAGSETRGGQPSYDYMFADTRKWAQQGLIDYITPQIYFPFEHKLVPYATLTDWWAKNCGNTRLYIGHGIYRVDESSDLRAWRDPNQIPRQLHYNRLSGKITGSIFFSANGLKKNHLGLTDSLKSIYSTPALTPDIENIAHTKSAKPNSLKIVQNNGNLNLSWSTEPNTTSLLYYFPAGAEFNLEDPDKILSISPDNSFETPFDARFTKGIFALVVRQRGKKQSEPVFSKL